MSQIDEWESLYECKACRKPLWLSGTKPRSICPYCRSITGNRILSRPVGGFGKLPWHYDPVVRNIVYDSIR